MEKVRKWESSTIYLLLLILFLSFLTEANAEKETDNALFKEITSSIFCPCGCDRMLVWDCSCGMAEKIKKYVKGKINAGAGKEEIIGELETLYGEKIIPISPEKGVGLMAWVASILAFFVGVSIVAMVLKTWIVGKKEKVIEVPSKDVERYKARIESELERYK